MDHDEKLDALHGMMKKSLVTRKENGHFLQKTNFTLKLTEYYRNLVMWQIRYNLPKVLYNIYVHSYLNYRLFIAFIVDAHPLFICKQTVSEIQ